VRGEEVAKRGEEARGEEERGGGTSNLRAEVAW
jgi:hypothetical protein